MLSFFYCQNKWGLRLCWGGYDQIAYYICICILEPICSKENAEERYLKLSHTARIHSTHRGSKSIRVLFGKKNLQNTEDGLNRSYLFENLALKLSCRSIVLQVEMELSIACADMSH